MKTPGQIAFEAYNESKGGLTYDGKPIPPWDELSGDKAAVHRAWEAAADALLTRTVVLRADSVKIGELVVVADKDGRPRLADVVAITQRLDGVEFRVRHVGAERERVADAKETWRLVPLGGPS